MSYAITERDKKTYSILTDTTLCTGCETCVHACKTLYKLPPDRNWRWKNKIDDLAARIMELELEGGGKIEIPQRQANRLSGKVVK